MIQLARVCHRSWCNREGGTASAMSADCGSGARSWGNVEVIRLPRCGVDRGSVPQIIGKIVEVIQLVRVTLDAVQQLVFDVMQ